MEMNFSEANNWIHQNKNFATFNLSSWKWNISLKKSTWNLYVFPQGPNISKFLLWDISLCIAVLSFIYSKAGLNVQYKINLNYKINST